MASSLNATINSLISSSLSSESTLSTTGVILSNLSTHAFNYRTTKTRVDEAVKLFSQTDSIDTVIMAPYETYLEKLFQYF